MASVKDYLDVSLNLSEPDKKCNDSLGSNAIFFYSEYKHRTA